VRVARWVAVIVVTVVALLAFAYAAVDTLWVVSNRDCPLGMEFERSGSDVLEHRPVPPKVVCKYEYATGDNGSTLYPPETITFDTLPSWAVAVALSVGSVLLWRIALKADSQATRQPAQLRD
jgi:hypothetical protein